MIIKEDYWNYCSRCDLVINTEDMFEPACSCISEVEDWSEEQFREKYNDLPRHVRENFHPPEKQEPQGNSHETH